MISDTFGHSPIDDELATISKIGDKSTVLYVAGDLLARQGVTSLFGIAVIVDSKNPAKNILDLVISIYYHFRLSLSLFKY
jgi:predicted metalloendopeptidase